MQPSTRGPKTVLIVDDEKDLRDSVSMALEAQGYNVVIAGDGREGISMAAEHTPSLILVDYRMPELNGVEFLDTLRNTEGLTDTPVVIITVDPELDLRKNASQLGIQGFLVKPFSMEELMQTVTNLLQTT